MTHRAMSPTTAVPTAAAASLDAQIAKDEVIFDLVKWEQFCEDTAGTSKMQHDLMNGKLRASGALHPGGFYKAYAGGTEQVAWWCARIAAGVGKPVLTRSDMYDALDWIKSAVAAATAADTAATASKQAGFATKFQSTDKALMLQLPEKDPRRVVWQAVHSWVQTYHHRKDIADLAKKYEKLPADVFFDPDLVLKSLLAWVANPDHLTVPELQLVVSALLPLHQHAAEIGGAEPVAIMYANRDEEGRVLALRHGPGRNVYHPESGRLYVYCRKGQNAAGVTRPVDDPELVLDITGNLRRYMDQLAARAAAVNTELLFFSEESPSEMISAKRYSDPILKARRQLAKEHGAAADCCGTHRIRAYVNAKVLRENGPKAGAVAAMVSLHGHQDKAIFRAGCNRNDEAPDEAEAHDAGAPAAKRARTVESQLREVIRLQAAAMTAAMHIVWE